MNKNKGFTLIELLVVIAIIGILSSVVLASLNSARNRGSDAAIKNNLANIRPQAEMVYDVPASYAGVCADTNIVAMLNSARSASGISAALVTASATAGTSTTAVCHSQVASWAANVPLRTDSAKSWCVDSTGASKEITGYLGANDFDC